MSLLRLHRAVAAAALLLLLALCALGPASCARVTLALPLEQTSGCNGCRKVIGDGVRVRDGPCTDKTALGMKFKGDKVTSTCTTFFNNCGHDWEEIKFEGGTAYMAAEYLKPCD